MKIFSLPVLLISVATISTISGSIHKYSQKHEVTKHTIEYSPNGGGDLLSYTVDIYFSQDYFEHPSTEYDPHLSTASLGFACSTMTEATPAYDEEWYTNQSKKAKAFLEKLEFNTFTINEDYAKSATIDTIGLCCAKKEYEDYTVVAVAPRSGGYFREWASNVHLGDGSKSDYMHEGWYNAANKLINFVTDFVNNNVTGKVKLWMAGFSRGGATTNIAAALIDNKLDKGESLFEKAYTTREDVYAYTFEAPQGANVNSSGVKKPKDSLYDNIFNIVNPLDIVPKLAMREYGFTRFGIDKYVTNKFYDPDNYKENRRTFNAFLDIFHQNKSTTLKPDDFQMAGFGIENLGIDILTTIISAIVTDKDLPSILVPFRDSTKKNYDANIAFNQLMGELVDNLGSRSKYVSKFQSIFENLMLIVCYEQNSAPNFMGALLKIISMSIILDTTIGSTTLTKAAIKTIWGDDLATEIYNLTTKLTNPLASTYWEKPGELLSIAAYINNIFENHYPDVVFAHNASQDSYYIEDYNKDKEDSEKISLVPLMDNANYGRMHFFGYNDIGLRLESKKGTRVINIEGHVLGKSDVKDCNAGYAAGYYSYATEEKMDVFMPVNRKYNISMKSYSKKPYHRCEYWAYYEFIFLNDSGVLRKQCDHKKEKVCFNSDRHKRDVTIKY